MSQAAATADFAPPAHPCPTCGSECKRHSTYTRRIKDVSLDGPVTLQIPVGNYRCLSCRKFFKPELPFAGKAKRYTLRAVRKATVAVQEDKTTYTALPHRLERDFAVRPAKSTGWAWFQEFAGSIDVREYLRWACSRFSGQISVDAVMDGNIQMWFATDPLNRDTILGYHRAESADAASLTAFLTSLRDEYGVRPLLFTGDDARVYDKTPAQVWPGVRVQLCHFHALRCLIYKHLRHSLRARLLAVKPPPPRRRRHSPEAFQDLQREHKAALPEWAKLHRKRRLFLKSLRSLAKPESVKHEEAAFIDTACQRHPPLAAFRQLILDIYAIMDSKDAAAAETLRRAFLAKWAGEAERDSHVRAAVSKFADDCWFGRLFPFAAFENGHRTTNSTERANRWFRKRQKTHYRCRKEHTIVKMLHADLIYRRERAPDGPPNRLRERAVEVQQTA